MEGTTEDPTFYISWKNYDRERKRERKKKRKKEKIVTETCNMKERYIKRKSE